VTAASGAEDHGRILLLDDDEPLLVLATRILRRLGYDVVCFTDPERALAAFREHPAAFDLVITDLAMPRGSGFDVLRAVRAADPTAPVAITSGCIRPAEDASARALGACALLRKPDTIEELTTALRQLCRDHRRCRR
jgi:DNA-binding response OmpR family regulator